MGTTDPADGQPATAAPPAVELAATPGAGSASGANGSPGVARLCGDGSAAPCSPQRRGARPVPVTVWRRVDGELAEVFDLVVPIALERVFTGFGPLPAVTATDEFGTPWGSSVGQTRTVSLADGGRLKETILELARPGLLRYEVVPTRGPLRLIVRHIEGRFVFSQSEAGGTVIRWTYVFRPRRGAQPAVHALAPIWRRYAGAVLERLAGAIAATAPRSGTDAAAG